MKVGDVMVPNDGPWSSWLRSGCGNYTHAILVSVEPFVMVSEDGDMLWQWAKPENYTALCEASPKARKKAFARWTDAQKLKDEE